MDSTSTDTSTDTSTVVPTEPRSQVDPWHSLRDSQLVQSCHAIHHPARQMPRQRAVCSYDASAPSAQYQVRTGVDCYPEEHWRLHDVQQMLNGQQSADDLRRSDRQADASDALGLSARARQLRPDTVGAARGSLQGVPGETAANLQ